MTPTAHALTEMVLDARRRTLEVTRDLVGDRLLGPRLAIVNPPLWELGHVGWFHERWVLRHAASLPPMRDGGDALYDSARVPHDTRWDLPLPSRDETLAYLATVQGRVLDQIARRGDDPATAYFVRLAVFHEDMHAEAFAYTRQTLGYGPDQGLPARDDAGGGPLEGDARVPGGRFVLGASRGEGFVFDNEKWGHEVEVRPFSIARAPVTQSQFASFVDDGGYEREALWSDAGWRWRCAAGARNPAYWRREGSWLRRRFDGWLPLEPHRPVLHVNAHEAEAYCAWARRRLPTELEWEAAAAGEPDGHGGLGPRKRGFPWGDEAPDASRANLDARAGDCVDVGALPGGDSAFGCRQMIGNVWEWTASAFEPYPGFEVDPYREYSAPWFGTHRVLRGGCWATRARLLRNTWRNFYTPDRRDVWAGFRTCSLDG